MNKTISTLNSFNSKVERLERSGFIARFKEDSPEVMGKFKSVDFEDAGNGEFYLTGELESWTNDYNEGEVDAVVVAQLNNQLDLSSKDTKKALNILRKGNIKVEKM